MPDNSIMKTILSPPVILAGVAIGAIILVSKGSGGSQSGNNPNPNITPVVQMNIAAMQQQVELAKVQAQYGTDLYTQDTARQAGILSFLDNINNSNNVVTGQIANSTAGVTNASIAASTALSLDVANNNERLSQAYVSAQVAEDTNRTQATIAQTQANAAQHIATTNAIGSIVGNTIGAVTKIATLGFG